ncbi:hypothetical protein WR25_16680 [Diploscapter pachys]|uniref:Uncharacterized protein n=1 Tax=Diploscapter pachys TaxID=2018661 RepID=A0A2A2LTW7_9BILA|nr:hypothetical protein WR25_16680 [Diploscapter pachys]
MRGYERREGKGVWDWLRSKQEEEGTQLYGREGVLDVRGCKQRRGDEKMPAIQHYICSVPVPLWSLTRSLCLSVCPGLLEAVAGDCGFGVRLWLIMRANKHRVEWGVGLTTIEGEEFFGLDA